MYRKLFRYHRKINRKKLILLITLFVLVMVGGYFGLRQDTRVATIDKIKSYLSNIEFRSGLDEKEIKESQLADLSSKMSSITGAEEENGELTDDALLLEKTKEVLGEETAAVPKLTLEEISEQVNKISKKVAVVLIQVQILSLEKISSEIAGEEELGEDTLDDISEKINQVSEQIESITLQLQQL